MKAAAASEVGTYFMGISEICCIFVQKIRIFLFSGVFFHIGYV
jgi:hypothetical protein